MSGRRRPLIIGLALLAALSACATGQVTQTARQQAGVNGAAGQAGPMAVRDAEFPFPHGEEHFYPQGSSVALKLTIVNTGGSADRLAAVQSPAAGSVRLNGQTTIPGRGSVRAVVPEASEPQEAQPTTTPAPGSPTTTQPGTTQPGTTQPGTTQPGTTQPGTAQQPTPTTTAAEPPTSSPPELADGELLIMLVELTEDLRPGRTVRVVLLFEQAGEVVLEVPIAEPTEPRGESGH